MLSYLATQTKKIATPAIIFKISVMLCEDISKMLDDPKHTVRTAAFSVAPMRNGFLLREDEWAYIQYGENGAKGIELYNIHKDPYQYTNLAQHPAHQETIARFKAQMAGKLRNIRNNDLNGD